MTYRRLWLIVVAGFVASGLGVAPRHAGATLRFGPLQISGNAQSQNLVRTPDASTWEYIQNRNTAAHPSRLRLARGRQVHQQVRHPVHREVVRSRCSGAASTTASTPPRPASSRRPTSTAGTTQRPELLRLRHPDRHPAAKTGNPNQQAHHPEPEPPVARHRGARHAQVREPAARGLHRHQVPRHPAQHPRRPAADRVGRDRQLPDARPRQLAQPHLALPAGDPGAGVRVGRDPPAVLDDQVPLRPGQRVEVLAELPRVVLEPGRLGAREAGLPAAALGSAVLQPADQPRGRRVLRRAVRRPVARSRRRRARAPASRCACACSTTRSSSGRATTAAIPSENSQVGVRYHGITPFGLEFTLNYFYQRWAGDDGTNSAPLQVLLQDPLHPKKNAKIVANSTQALPEGHLPGRGLHARTCTPSASRPTTPTRRSPRPCSASRRIYDIGMPFFDVAKVGVIDTPALPGVTKKNMWKGMIAFDRPTWIRWLNKKSTWFLTGQFFWHYLLDNHELPRRRRSPNLTPAGSRRAGGVVSGRRPRPAVERPRPSRVSVPRQDPRLGDALHPGGLLVLPRRQHRADARHGGRPGEPVEHGSLLGRRLRGARRLRGEPRPALLHHAARAQHADLRDLGPRRPERGPHRDVAPAHLPVLSSATLKAAGGPDRLPPSSAMLPSPTRHRVAVVLALVGVAVSALTLHVTQPARVGRAATPASATSAASSTATRCSRADGATSSDCRSRCGRSRVFALGALLRAAGRDGRHHRRGSPTSRSSPWPRAASGFAPGAGRRLVRSCCAPRACSASRSTS